MEPAFAQVFAVVKTLCVAKATSHSELYQCETLKDVVALRRRCDRLNLSQTVFYNFQKATKGCATSIRCLAYSPSSRLLASANLCLDVPVENDSRWLLADRVGKSPATRGLDPPQG